MVHGRPKPGIRLDRHPGHSGKLPWEPPRCRPSSVRPPNTSHFPAGWHTQSQHKDQAFQVLQAAFNQDLLATYDVQAGQITPRKDVADVPAYKNVPLSSFFTSLVQFTQFRPGFPAYPKISLQIDSAMQQVM